MIDSRLIIKEMIFTDKNTFSQGRHPSSKIIMSEFDNFTQFWATLEITYL